MKNARRERRTVTLLHVQRQAVGDEMGRDPKHWKEKTRIVPMEHSEELRRRYNLS